jgi:DnaJ-class molecular chaperone
MSTRYHILGVERDAMAAEIEKACRTLQITHHPDKTVGLTEEKRAESATISKAVNVADEILSDPQLHASYDSTLLIARGADTPMNDSSVTDSTPSALPTAAGTTKSTSRVATHHTNGALVSCLPKSIKSSYS